MIFSYESQYLLDSARCPAKRNSIFAKHKLKKVNSICQRENPAINEAFHPRGMVASKEAPIQDARGKVTVASNDVTAAKSSNQNARGKVAITPSESPSQHRGLGLHLTLFPSRKSCRVKHRIFGLTQEPMF